MNAEFNWWLLIVGLVLGAGLTWLVMAESTRRDADVTDSEQRSEALWIATTLTAAGRPTEDDRVEEILRLHREYLGAPPPDDPAEAKPPEPTDAWPDPRPTAAMEAPPVAESPAAESVATVDEGATHGDAPSDRVREDAPVGTPLPDAAEAPAKDRA